MPFLKRFTYFALISNSVHSIKLIILFCSIAYSTAAQIGGKHSFEFLNVSPSARLSALGGVNISLADRDLNFFASNPALAGDTLSGVASLNYQFYLADVGQAFFSYAHNFNRVGPLIFGIQHMRYGTIQGYDINGAETAEWNSQETAFMIARQHQINRFRLGVNLKIAFSAIAGYRATAVMADVGGCFIHPDKSFTAGLVLKNIGFITSDYAGRRNSSLPFDVQLGASFKPEHMPLRFSLTAFNLTQKDITYYNPAADQTKPGTLVKLLSHVNVGTEILIHKNFNIMAGYNFLVHQALKLEEGGGGAGVSFGFSASIKSFEFVFSRNTFVAGNAGYCFTLSTDVNKILKRR